MNRIRLIAVVAASMLWLSGCMVISSEEHRSARDVRVVAARPVRVVEVIHVPNPPPRPHREHAHPRGWR
jgi:hypothetical protein